MTADRAALVEKVAKLMRNHPGVTWTEAAADVIALIGPAIRADVLEEAAKVADVYGPLSAAAIRSLKGDK
jgi:hypothetical protein